MSIRIGRTANIRLNRNANLNITSEYVVTPVVPLGDIYYVSDTDGNDTYTAAQAQNPLTPWKTLTRVQNNMSVFQPGDQILFKRGDTFSGTLTVNKSGTPGLPITFGAYGSGPKPKFIGTGATITQLFYMFGRSYIIFDNLHITDPTLDPNNRIELAKIQRAFTFDGAAGTNGYCKITNCDIELVGIGFYCKTSYNTMEGCDTGNLRMVVSDSVLPDNDYGANPIVIASSNNSVLSNYFHDCWANSIDYGYDGGAIELFSESSTRPVSNNFIAYNTFYDCNGGVEIGGNNNTCILNNNTFVYNKFINNDGAVLIQNSGLFAAQITNVNLYNNIFVESTPSSRGSASSMFRFRAPSSVPNMIVMKNNIIQLYGTIDVGRLNADLTQQLQGPQCVHEKNVYNLGPGSVLNFSANIGEIITSIPYWTDTTNPDPINWDYSPLPSSILINNGQDLGLTRDFAGNPVNNPPEIGILEYI